MTRCGGHRGFTLLEVLAALSVLALGLGVAVSILSGGLRQLRWSAEASAAAEVARSVLDTAGIAEPLVPGRHMAASRDDRYHWRLDVTPWQSPDRAHDGPDAMPLYHLALELHWDEGGPRQRLRLETLRAVPIDRGGL